MKKYSLVITVCLLIFLSCNRNSMDIDVSDINTRPLKLMRLEDDLFALREENFDEGTKKIRDQYGIFYEHYLSNFLVRRGTADSLYKSSVLSYINDRDVRGTYRCVKKLYPASVMEELMPEVNNCVKRFNYYFPGRKLPVRLITCTTGWNFAFAYFDSSLVLGLDMYMTDTSVYYQMLRYPQYQVRKMNPENILPDIARGWLLTEFDNMQPENTLLNHCVFYGKLYYAVNALLSNTADSLIIGYSKKQMQYCASYEKNLWSFFAEKNRLYENNMNTVRELTSEGPFSGVISKECPPRIGMWVGWQIVKSYMKNNEGVTLEQLMAENNAQKILNKSKYRP